MRWASAAGGCRVASRAVPGRLQSTIVSRIISYSDPPGPTRSTVVLLFGIWARVRAVSAMQRVRVCRTSWDASCLAERSNVNASCLRIGRKRTCNPSSHAVCAQQPNTCTSIMCAPCVRMRKRRMGHALRRLSPHPLWEVMFIGEETRKKAPRKEFPCIRSCRSCREVAFLAMSKPGRMKIRMLLSLTYCRCRLGIRCQAVSGESPDSQTRHPPGLIPSSGLV